MTKRVHISVAVTDFDTALGDYGARLGMKPDTVIPGRYARWRTELLNFTVSCKPGQPAGLIRHIGFEDDDEKTFREEKDNAGITWEYFSAEEQDREIKKLKVPGA